MSEPPNPVRPTRETIAPRHESLTKEFAGEIGPRPLDFGEGRIWLVAKDPHTLFAYWEFVPSQHPEAVGGDGNPYFFLRILNADGEIEREIHLHSEDANLHTGVAHADSVYSAELGFYSKGGVWCFIGKSGVAYTPPEGSAPDDVDIRFATIPANLPLQKSSKTTHGSQAEKSLARFPKPTRWTKEQERIFVALLAEDVKAGGRPEGRAARVRAKMLAAPAKKPFPAALLASLDDPAPTSPGAQASSWHAAPGETLDLHVNAEIIFYGGTSPANLLTINSKPATLRHDGTFRIHTRLPDGEFEIPIAVTSPDGKRTRRAVLRFSRETEADSGTGASPQPDYLPPSPL